MQFWSCKEALKTTRMYNNCIIRWKNIKVFLARFEKQRGRAYRPQDWDFQHPYHVINKLANVAKEIWRRKSVEEANERSRTFKIVRMSEEEQEWVCSLQEQLSGVIIE